MAQTDALKKYLDAGMAFTALTRSRAEQVVKELVAAGELQRNQTKGAIDELVERSKKNAETLSEQVRKEVDSQLASLGLARKADVERLEAELAELKGSDPATPKAPAAEKKAPEKKAPEKKAAEKKAPEKKAPEGEKPAKPAAKTAKKAATDGEETPTSGSLPARKAGGGEAKAPAKTAKKAGASEGAGSGTSGALPGREVAAKGEDKGEGGEAPAKPAKPAKKASRAMKKESSLSPANKGDDQPGVDAAMPAKKAAKKQG